ncbi:MAG: hypothetical protein ABL902_09015 [Gallionella sp.]|nr:hypothetical protein [Gallionella sp.]
MQDPLNGFDWKSLYSGYDSKCLGYAKESVYLAAFGIDRPTTDRALYYKLIKAFSKEQRALSNELIGIYEALLYWKLYSQSTSPYNLNKWFRQDVSKRKYVEENLLCLFQEIPDSLERTPSAVLDMVKWLGRFSLPGMASSGALPVRTTFLHFIFPSVVPIFDQMVLKAVGSWTTNANHNASVLKEYLPFAWDLADRYAQNCSGFEKESPIRVIDMALWVGRGK